MANLGNIGVSSLLRSANSVRAKAQAYSDQEAAFNWNMSDKSMADYQAYSRYLQTASRTAATPSAALTYQTKAIEGQRTFVSHEIQRQTIATMEGSGTLQDKYNTIAQFHDAALNNGDLNLAQTLRSQADSVDVAIQNQRIAQQALAKSMAENQVTTIQDYVSKQMDQVNNMLNLVKQYGIGEVDKALSSGGGTPTNVWDKIATVVGTPDANGVYPANSLLGGLYTMASSLPAQQANTLMKQANDLISGNNFDVPGVGKISLQDVVQQQAAVRAGQSLFYDAGSTLSPDGTVNHQLARSKTDNYVWSVDASGKYSLIPTMSQNGKVEGDASVLHQDAQGNYLDSSGNIIGKFNPDNNTTTWAKKSNGDLYSKKDAMMSLNDMVSKAGFQLNGKNDADGTFNIAQTANSLNTPLNVTGGADMKATIDDQGHLRFITTDVNGNAKLYGMSFDQQGNASVNPIDETNLSHFGDVGWKNSTGDQIGHAMTNAIYGQSNPGSISALNNFTGTDNTLSAFMRPGNSSDVLATGSAIKQFNLKQAAQLNLAQDFGGMSQFGSVQLSQQIATAGAQLGAQANPQGNVGNPQYQAPVRLQAAPSFNLNQTPGLNNPNFGLKVANPAPRPLSVSAPAPNPTLSVSAGGPSQPLANLSDLSY